VVRPLHLKPMFFILLALALGVLLGIPSLVFSYELDDISIQVLGLDEIPGDVLEHIPMPSQELGNLSDIYSSIITRQSVTIEITTPTTGSNDTTAGPAPNTDTATPPP